MKARRTLLFLSVFILLVGARGGFISAQETPEKTEIETETEAPPSRITQSEAVSSAGAVQGDAVSLNFFRADLLEVIPVFTKQLKINYILDPGVKGTVTIYSAEPIKRENLLPVFHQILRMNNAVAVKAGDLYHIVPIEQGKGLAGPMRGVRKDGYALQVVPVRLFPAREMKKLLAPFVTPGGEILDVGQGNLLIMVDHPSNIQRLMQIKDLIDINALAGMHLEVYQAKEASVEELAEEMTKVMQAHASSSSAPAEHLPARFVPILRNNKLLVISYSKTAWDYIKQWLEEIDTVGEGPGRRIFIYAVENGKATELAAILTRIYGAPGAIPRGETPPSLRELHGALSRELRASTGRGTSTPTRDQTSTPAPQSAASATPPGTPSPRESPTVAPKAEGEIRIDADPATNSLIVLATANEYENIKEVLKKLDIVPRQVLMEVLVAEVTLTDDLSFGIEYAIRRRGSAAAISSDLESKGALEGTLSSAFPRGLTSIITSGGQDFRAVINALMDDSRVKVLSNPIVLAADNRPARIQVGSEEPVATGTTTTQVGTAASSTTIEFRNTGRILTIIPQVNSRGLVNLQVKIEVSSRGELVRVGSDEFFAFDTRDAETTAVVQDGNTLIIGGIMTERVRRARTGIPYLMDIPILGRLFGLTTDDVDRSELVILITPYVIRDREEAEKVTKQFMEKLDMVTREIEEMRKGEETSKSNPSTPSSPAAGSESREAPVKDRAGNDASAGAPASVWAALEEPIEEVEQAEKVLTPTVKEEKAIVKEKTTVSVQRVRENPRAETRKSVWAVQVGAYTDEKAAENLVKELTDKGYDSYIVMADLKGQVWHRVRVGRLATRGEARKLRGTLKTEENFTRAFTVNS